MAHITTQINQDEAYHLMKIIEGLSGKSKREDFRLAMWNLTRSQFCNTHMIIESKINTLLIRATDTRLQAVKQAAIDEIIAYIEGLTVKAAPIEEPAIVETDTETPRTCTCGQLLNADENKCGVCIYQAANEIQKPAFPVGSKAFYPAYMEWVTILEISYDGKQRRIISTGVADWVMLEELTTAYPDPYVGQSVTDRYEGVVIARDNFYTLIHGDTFGFNIRIDANESLTKFLLIGDEVTFQRNWNWAKTPRAIVVKRKEIDPRDAEIERLKQEISQLKDERDMLQAKLKSVKAYERREEDFEDWKTDKPYEDKSKGSFF